MGSSQLKPNSNAHFNRRRRGRKYERETIRGTYKQLLQKLWEEYLSRKPEGHKVNNHDQCIVYRQYCAIIGGRKK